MENNALKSKNRIDWIDLAKGIGMILVVVAHTVCIFMPGETEILVRGLIYSFHMPLFFILSAYTYRSSDSGEAFLKKTEKAFRHLILPAVVLFILQTIYDIAMQPDKAAQAGWMDYTAERINIFVYASAKDVSIAGASIPNIGISWFLFGLFFGRTLYDYLHLRIKSKKVLTAVICLLSFVGVTIGRVQNLPFSWDIALAIIPFFAFGNYLKRIDLNKNKWKAAAVCFVVWAVCFFIQYNTSMSRLKYTLCQTMHLPENIVSEFIYIYDRGRYLDLGVRSYPLFPLCFISAIAGVMVLIYLCTLLVKAKKLMIPLIFIGRNSMYFFWVHAMDDLTKPLWLTYDRVGSIIPRLITDIIVFLILMLVMWSLKKLRTFIKRKISLTEN